MYSKRKPLHKFFLIWICLCSVPFILYYIHFVVVVVILLHKISVRSSCEIIIRISCHFFSVAVAAGCFVHVVIILGFSDEDIKMCNSNKEAHAKPPFYFILFCLLFSSKILYVLVICVCVCCIILF